RDRLAIQGQRPSILQNEPTQTRRPRYVPRLSVGLAFILFEIEWGCAEIRTTLRRKVCSEQKGEAKYEFPHSGLIDYIPRGYVFGRIFTRTWDSVPSWCSKTRWNWPRKPGPGCQ